MSEPWDVDGRSPLDLRRQWARAETAEIAMTTTTRPDRCAQELHRGRVEGYRICIAALDAWLLAGEPEQAVTGLAERIEQAGTNLRAGLVLARRAGAERVAGHDAAAATVARCLTEVRALATERERAVRQGREDGRCLR